MQGKYLSVETLGCLNTSVEPLNATIRCGFILLVGFWLLQTAVCLADDLENEIDRLKALAESGIAPAAFELGRRYEEGKRGAPLNTAEAIRYYEIAAGKGNAYAMNRLGVIYFNGHYGMAKNTVVALELFERSAALGTSVGQYFAGVIYSLGDDGIDKDYKQAVVYFRQSAIQGNTAAQNALGVMHYNGFGVEQSYDLARSWYEKAADAGLADAQVNLASMYQQGLGGLEKNDEKALVLYKSAAAKGNSHAQAMVDHFRPQQTGKVIMRPMPKENAEKGDDGATASEQ